VERRVTKTEAWGKGPALKKKKKGRGDKTTFDREELVAEWGGRGVQTTEHTGRKGHVRTARDRRRGRGG